MFSTGVFNLRKSLPKLSFDWDVQWDNVQLSDNHLSQNLLNELLLLGGQKLN